MCVSYLSQVGNPVEHVSGVPPVAWPETPFEAGELADESFLLEWTDYDGPSPTGTVTVNWYYTNEMPRTFPLGVIPDTLTGTAIVTGIDEADLENRYAWDTSSVAADSYFIWSIIDEPPEEMAVLRVVAFARGVVTVAHSGDIVHPAIIFTRPDSPYYIADEHFLILYQSFDPDGTGRVKLEASSSTIGDDFVLLAEDLPASRDGSFAWDTTALSEGDWTLRATIEDARGLKHTSYCRFFLRVQHVRLDPDAGIVSDSGYTLGRDANGVQSLDSGLKKKAHVANADACSCQSVLALSDDFTELSLVLVLMLLVLGRRRWSIL
jgi:hypothetical protein